MFSKVVFVLNYAFSQNWEKGGKGDRGRDRNPTYGTPMDRVWNDNSRDTA